MDGVMVIIKAAAVSFSVYQLFHDFICEKFFEQNEFISVYAV